MEHPNRMDDGEEVVVECHEDVITPPPPLGSRGRRARERQPIGGLLAELVRELRQLARSEARLARTELNEKLHEAGTGARTLGAGALTAFAGFLFLLGAAMLGLDLVLRQLWLSALLVGGVVMTIGLAMLAKARRELRVENLAPQRTAHSLQRDAEFVQEELRRAR